MTPRPPAVGPLTLPKAATKDLLTGAHVAEARRRRCSNSDDFPSPEADFLEASIVAEDRRLSQEKAQQVAQIRMARKRARAVALATILGVLALAATFVAIRVNQARWCPAPGQDSAPPGRLPRPRTDGRQRHECSGVSMHWAVVRLTLSWDGTATVWDLNNPLAPPRILGDRPHGYGRFCADWHAKSDLIATGGTDGNVHIWKPDGSRWIKDSLRHPSPVELLKFSPDGSRLATGCRDGGLRLWSLTKAMWTGSGWYHAGPVTRVQFSRDG